jgi:catalase
MRRIAGHTGPVDPNSNPHRKAAMTETQPTPPTTTDSGIPVESDEHSLTIGPDGPILLHDHYLIEQMAAFNRERVPERQPTPRAAAPSGASRSPTTSVHSPKRQCLRPAPQSRR